MSGGSRARRVSAAPLSLPPSRRGALLLSGLLATAIMVPGHEATAAADASTLDGAVGPKPLPSPKSQPTPLPSPKSQPQPVPMPKGKPTPLPPKGLPTPKLPPGTVVVLDAPAFGNASLEDTALTGWELGAPVAAPKGKKKLPAALAISKLRKCQERVVQSKSLRIAGQRVVSPALGGDYWDVPFPALVDVGQEGSCYAGGSKQVLSGGLKTPVIDGTKHAALSYLVRTVPTRGPVRVELRTDAGKILATQRPATGPGMQQEVFDLTGISEADRAAMRIWVFPEGRTTEVQVDNFRLWTASVKPWTARTPTTKPDGVWGFADLHTHPAAHLGFGGLLVFGAPDENWSEWGACEHGGAHLNRSVITQMTERAGHTGTGAPKFQYWPRSSSVLHQQLHEKWLRRAWQGGLRLIVFHAVNNALLGRYFHNDRKDSNDMVSAKRQLTYMRNWVNRSDFMEIAKSPEDARRIAGSGKLAVILGVEVDSLGGCHEKQGVLNEQGVSYKHGCNLTKIKAELDDLYENYDVRHVFPIHLADNAFGGAALYELDFAKFMNWFMGKDFVPTNSWAPNGRAADVVPHIGRKLTSDSDTNADTFLGGVLGNVSTDQRSWAGGPHVNSKALTRLGKDTLEYMWDLGMIVEVDHMSELASRQALAKAETRGVAMVAGHTAPRELLFVDDTKADKHKMAAENNKSDAQIQRIHQNGGVMGIGTGPSDIERGPFAGNDCSGTSQTWLQFYTHTAKLKSASPDGMRNFSGIALGTDMHLQGQLWPRFGASACLGRTPGTVAQGYDTKRPVSAAGVDRQTDAVSYKTKAWTYYSSRFQRPHGDEDVGTKYMGNYRRYPAEPYGARERAVWHALILADAYRRKGVDPLTADLSSAWEWWHWTDGARHFALGFLQTADQTSKDCHDIHPKTKKPLGGFGCGERRAAYLVKSGRTTPDPTDHPDVKAKVALYMPMLLRTWRQYNKMLEGGNKSAPLQRCEGSTCGGSREFDYNLDGLAHYGLIPDFLQDASNQLRRRPVGEVRDLQALFHSAEDYIQMWEKVWAKRKP